MRYQNISITPKCLSENVCASCFELDSAEKSRETMSMRLVLNNQKMADINLETYFISKNNELTHQILT